MKSGKKVYVGLSGGVDSSVSALLLKNAGYDVTGVFIRGWQPDWIPCTWKIDRISAMRTAAYLEIPFLTLDLEMQYKNKVVTYLLDEYSKGNTPNPDMLCNREIKFGDFLKWSLKNGADYVATGHYAQNIENNLYESADIQKDQSYFLSQLTQKELKHILFPIGAMQKSEVRKIALQNNLPVATRKDSQGICFVGDLSMKEFLKKELNPKIGKVINEGGEEIGEHDGSILYTIGERHGFRISNESENQKVYYVISKDIDNNTITVSDNLSGQVESKNSKDIIIKNISFTNKFSDLENTKNLTIRIRYRGEKNKVQIISLNENENQIILKNLEDKELEYAGGQFAVFYDGEKCLGGGEFV